MKTRIDSPAPREEDFHLDQDQLRLVLDTIPGLVWTARPDGFTDYFNRPWTDFAGLPLKEVVGWGWQRAVHPEDLPGLVEYWKDTLLTGSEAEAEARLRRHDGVYRWFLFRAVPLRDASGRVTKWYGQNTDIDDRKRAMIWLAGEKKIQQMIASRASLPATLDEICTLAERLTEGVRVSILLLSPDGEHLLNGAGPSLPAQYRAAIHGGRIGPCAGSCGTAAFRGEPVFVSDIATDPLWADYAGFALEHDLRACWSTPVFSSGGKILGTFAFYLQDAGEPSAGQRQIVEQFAHLASIAIELTRDLEGLRRSEAYLAEAQRLSRTGSFGWCVPGGNLVWSDETYRILGYDRALSPSLDLVFDRVHPRATSF
ncbi:MAG: GAF domain-containing protein [Luteolibacter sp.]